MNALTNFDIFYKTIIKLKKVVNYPYLEQNKINKTNVIFV